MFVLFLYYCIIIFVLFNTHNQQSNYEQILYYFFQLHDYKFVRQQCFHLVVVGATPQMSPQDSRSCFSVQPTRNAFPPPPTPRRRTPSVQCLTLRDVRWWCFSPHCNDNGRRTHFSPTPKPSATLRRRVPPTNIT